MRTWASAILGRGRLAVPAAALAIAGCTGAGAPASPTTGTAPPTPTTAPETTTTSPAPVPEPLEGFPVRTIAVGSDEWRVAVAETPERRARGLMGVEDLGPLQGMLFVFPEEVHVGFWMKDTLIPLDIAFFDDEGRLVDVLTMEPCREDPCPVHTPSGPYRWALEAPAGDLADLPPDARLGAPEG